MGMTQIASGNAMSFSAFDPSIEREAMTFRPNSVLYGDRYAGLERRERYYLCTQHDGKMFDFDGRLWSPRSTTPLLSSEKASWYVPLRDRRPSAPYPLGKIIVDSFTNLLFGENRFPQIRVSGDEKEEDFKQTLARVGQLPLKMIQARGIGGSSGTVGMSWCFYKGRIRYEVHNSKNLYVHTWQDRLLLRPDWVSEVYPFWRVLWDGRAFSKVWYWFRRDWTRDADIIFEPAPILPGPANQPVNWQIDLKNTIQHGDGVCHLKWIQNLPSDDVDGVCDYEGLFDQMDTLDVLQSVVTRGAALNLDPTLKLKMDPELVNRMGVKKGSDNAIVTGEEGDAEYMELAGTSIEAGVKLIDAVRKSILEGAQCVVVDPSEIAAQGTSSVAMKMMYAAMTSKTDIFREQYGQISRELVDEPTEIARQRMKNPVSVQVINPETGQEETQTQQPTIVLPPKVEEVPVEEEAPSAPPSGEQPKDPNAPPEEEDPDAAPPDPNAPPPPPKPPALAKPPEEPKTRIKRTPREPGEGGTETDLRWPPYFPPTPDDQSKIATTFQLATGKPFLSQQTATEAAAQAFGVDPAEEWKRVQKDGKQDEAKQAAMTPPIGGEVGHPDDLPPGAKPKKPPFGGPKPPLPNDFGKGPPKPPTPDDEGAAGGEG
jgi:hypothetical protein